MIVGRNRELEILNGLMDSRESQFVAVYGRRRVGKTFLVRQAFKGLFSFQHTGLANADKKKQLAEFSASLSKWGSGHVSRPKTWYEAFHVLENLLESKPKGKKVVFIDELSWMDTAKSDFVSALEHFWNNWASARNDIVLVVCGSATSWIMSKIVMDKGGLHNRLTNRILLKPFTLQECELYAKGLGLEFVRKDLVELYMVLGGIPFYWSFLRKGESVAQNLDRMFFSELAPLGREFEALYASLFKHATPYIEVVEALSTKKSGLLRENILKETKLSDNTQFTKILTELEQSGFIRKYYVMGKKERDSVYQLMDNYTLFYFQFIQNNVSHDEMFYSHRYATSAYKAWSGLAFERVCLHHINQIKFALGISGIASNVHSWVTKANDSHDGAQIDLLIDRADNCINICEMKFNNEEFSIDKKYDVELSNKISIFKEVSKTRKNVFLTIITVNGLKKNQYSGRVAVEIDAKKLFL